MRHPLLSIIPILVFVILVKVISHFSLHCCIVLEAHPDSFVPDLRALHPFSELSEFVGTIDLDVSLYLFIYYFFFLSKSFCVCILIVRDYMNFILYCMHIAYICIYSMAS